ncbi:MAG TPA: hypothetical protein DIU15_00410 [Deltaproteobacteria bacterium]|nr:AMMECR1 domain-containing protein [Deltaproteobacteria bacterium]HCP44490.1 hypothetical protein [Deltaproteobacteria bacterium]
MPLTPLAIEHQHELLALARQALVDHLAERTAPRVQLSESHPLCRPAGAFVTLRAGDRLRGCVGSTRADRPLHQVVAWMAVAAGTQDPRFAALHEDELSGLTLSISVLGPLEPCSLVDVVVGRDGLVVEGSGRRGLLLPEVATDQGWSVEEFVGRTCEKAGLPSNAVAEGAQLFRFQTQYFSED